MIPHGNRGKLWEQRLDVVHAHYMATGRALVIRNGPPVQITGKQDARGRMRAVVVDRAPPDYTLVSDGCVYLIEAKQQTRGSRWSWANLHAHQADRFDRLEGQGGSGVILLRWEAHQRLTVLMWRDVSRMWRHWHANSLPGKRVKPGEGSLTLGAACELAVWHGAGADYLDWLGRSNG